VGVHLYECEAPISLEAGLDNVAEVLEERDEIVLSRVWCEVSNVASSLPGGSLLDNHIIALDPVGWEVVMAERSSWRHAHGGHRLLLRYRWLALLVCPVATDRARPEPLAIHGTQGLLGILAFTESHEAIAPRSASLHVPHNPGFRNGTERGEGLEENLVIDFV
jgi:hypothetical protein